MMGSPMGGHGMMGSPMGGLGMMEGGMMRPGMLRMVMILVDTDGDGTISLQEFQAAHERIFRAMDANRDGRLTLEELQAFMQTMGMPAPQRRR
jgi:Ca2+-binding EF-hand superfamily protein